MKNTRRAARRHLTDAARAAERAPVEVVLALMVAVAFSSAVELGDDGGSMRAWTEFVVFALLGAAAAWTGTLLHALGEWSGRRRWIVTVAGLALATLYATLFLRLDLLGPAWRAALLVTAAVAWVLGLPALTTPRDDRLTRFRRISGRILLRFSAACLYAAALFIGLAAALAAIDSLFDLDMRPTIYVHVFGWLAFALVPWIVFGGVDDYVRPLEEKSPVAVAVHRLAGFLLLPLLALYYAIVYAYALRIAVVRELPTNLVSPLVLASGAVAVLALVLFDVRGESAGGTQPSAPGAPSGSGPSRARGAVRALRLVPPLFIPLGALGLWALAIRVQQYGWTEFRYIRVLLLAALLGLAAVATVQIMRNRRLALHVVPLALGAVLLLAAIGPWSAPDVSRRNQQARLASALRDAEVLGSDGKVAVRDEPPRVITADAHREISSIASYLYTHFGRDALAPLFAGDAPDDEHLRDLADHLGLRAAPAVEEVRFFSGRLPTDVAVTGLPGGTLYRVLLEPRHEQAALRQPALSTSARGTRVEIRAPGEPLFAELGPLAEWLVDAAVDDASGSGAPPRRPMRGGGRSLPPDSAVVPLLDGAGAERGRLLVLQMDIQVERERLSILRMEGLASLPVR